MGDLLIRPIVDTDLDTLLEINAANVPAVGPVDIARLRYLVDESALALVVLDDEVVAGFCLVIGPGSTYDSVNYTWFMEHHPASLYLDRVAFGAAFQGRGFGAALYDEVDRRMRADFSHADALTLEVNVDPPNEQSLRFHAKRGFVEVGRQMSKGIEVSLMLRPVD